ncbi:hypothetical protein PpBr36_01295 [Pyricularia pennisetigena]|uniref:hypothetical protein n=1 Tax=Pyricularia pennisetigena TaxID=1578925 RepID=UPI0011504E76|nr:hypothetical protein PpBr36_01295 [Pyricularia pennisetigena]TLS28478.1 hypothetical protein PpBr36_01295 [Pyricularia pennisetigena]
MNFRPRSPSLRSEKEARPGRASTDDDIEAAQPATHDAAVGAGTGSGKADEAHSTPLAREQHAGSQAEAKGHSSSDAAAVSPGGMYNPRSLRFWAIMGCNFLALFLVALDRTILATAVPKITDEFHSLGDVGWYASSYMLTTSASQLLFGRIYKFYPTKWTFLISIVGFEIGSAICGAAPSSTVFIVGRSIAGLASAGIFTGCMLMFMMVPLHKRPMFQGLFGMTFGLASVMGPLVGGAFTGTVTWRWCFYMNLPIGLVAFVCMILWWTPPEKRTEPAPLLTHFKRLDPLGTFFFLPAVVSLLLALEWGGSTYSWNSGVIIGLFVACAVLVSAFVAVQILRPETATIPARVITQRSVLFATVFTFFIAGGMLMCVYFLPIWFQTAQGVDPLRSGIYTLPLVLSLVVSSAMSGIFTSKIGYYMPSMLLCPVIMAIGEGLMSTFSPTTDSGHWIGFQFLTGFGLGFGMQTGGLAIQTVLPMADVSTGIAINMFAQQLGGAVFTSVGQAILSNVLVRQLVGVDGLQAEEIIKGGITNLLSHVRREERSLVISAYNFACTRIFLAAMGLSCCALLCAFCMEWRSIKKPHSDNGVPQDANGNTAPALLVKEGAMPDTDSVPDTERDATSNKEFTETTRHRDARSGLEPGAVNSNTASEASFADTPMNRHSLGHKEIPIIAKHTNGLVIGVVPYAESPTDESTEDQFFSEDTQSDPAPMTLAERETETEREKETEAERENEIEAEREKETEVERRKETEVQRETEAGTGTGTGTGTEADADAKAEAQEDGSDGDSFVTVTEDTNLDGQATDQGEVSKDQGEIAKDQGDMLPRGSLDLLFLLTPAVQKSSGMDMKPEESEKMLDHRQA